MKIHLFLVVAAFGIFSAHASYAITRGVVAKVRSGDQDLYFVGISEEKGNYFNAPKGTIKLKNAGSATSYELHYKNDY